MIQRLTYRYSPALLYTGHNLTEKQCNNEGVIPSLS